MICIIVPVFNVKNYLDRCVNSILNQTITNFELVLVDDGSTDGSGKICDDYNCIDKRVKVFHQKNSGQSKARNIGIDYAFSNQKIEYITFIDSDDIVSNKYLEVLYNAMVSEKTDMCIAESKTLQNGEIFVENNNNVIETSEEIETFWVKYNSPVVWGKLYKKSLFNDIRYPEGVIYEDEATTYKLVFRCKRITHCSSVIYGYNRFNPNNTMNQKATPQKQALWLNSFKQQLDYYYKNNYKKMFNKYFRYYVNFIQQAVIDFYTDKEFFDFFNDIKKEFKNLPNEYPLYFKTTTLKREYKRVFKQFKGVRKNVRKNDYFTLKKQKGCLYVFLYMIKNLYKYSFSYNYHKISD